jgi:hypothetical protein
MPILLAQCLCPNRHTIAAVADAGPQEDMVAGLRAAVRACLQTTLNPWCGICGAIAETWTYEVGVTRFKTMAEAERVLNAEEAAQQAIAEILKAQGRTYDAPTYPQN